MANQLTTSAIHTDYFKDFREAHVIKEATTTEEVEKEEKLLSDMAQMGGWEYLKAYILDLEDVLDSLVKTTMESGASFEEIGQKSIVSELAKGFLTRVIEKVEDARTALEIQK